MPSTPKYFRLTVRNWADDADLFVVSTKPTDTNPYITEPPSGDGNSIDAITGAATTGSYTYRFADVLLPSGARFFTQHMADVYARQQLISLRAIGEESDDGTTWVERITGYVMRAALPSAIEAEIAVGGTRRRESSREVFRGPTGRFGNMTTVIGGPVLQDFAGLLTNHTTADALGGWTYAVDTNNSSPQWVKMELATNGGFDPRKNPTTAFSSVSTAIADYTNNWARPFFQPATTWLSSNIQGQFKGLIAKLIPAGGTEADAIFLVPLSVPSTTTGPWWANYDIDNLILAGSDAPLYLPKSGFDVDGDPVTFNPTVATEWQVWVYAEQISEANPLHVYEHPVDLWEKLRLDAGYVAGVDYDNTNLAALKATVNAWVGADIRLALRITTAYKLVDFDRQVIYGPFRLSTRVVDGKVQLFSIRVAGTAEPTDTIELEDLRSDEGTVWEVSEDSVVTAAILKQLRLIPWTTEESEQPDSDSLIARPWPVDTIENSDDDIPPGLADTGREVTLGDIPGTIVVHDATPTNIVPLPFDPFLVALGNEIFELFGRGAAEGDLYCLPGVTNQVGEQVLVDLLHRPNAVASQSPVSQRGGPRRVLILQRTENPEGPTLRVMDAEAAAGGGPTGVGGGTEEETDPTTITPVAPLAFAAGYGEATANWVDSYPQFHTYIEWQAHPPGETTFTALYGGEHLLLPNVFTHTQTGIGIGWVARCRYRLTDNIDVSSFSSYSNEVTISGGSPPPTPTDVPTTLVATSPVADEAHAEWVNTNAVLQIRIQWQGSTLAVPTLKSFVNIAGGTRLLAATTDEDDQPTGAAVWAKFRVCYVNSAGVEGPSVWSDPVEITS